MLFKLNSGFRHLFLARVFSILAESMMFFALLKWIEMQSQHMNSFTWFYVAFYLPITFFSLPIGAWIENKTLQKVMIYSDFFRVVALIVFALFMYQIGYEWTFVLLIIISILGQFFLPANQSLLTFVVSNEDRAKANGLLQMAYTVSKITGGLLASFLIKQSVSIPILLFLSAIILFLSLILVVKIKPYVKKERVGEGKIVPLMKEGILYILNDKKLKLLFTLLALSMFIVTSIDILLISYFTETLHLGVENISFVGAASLLGILLGSTLTTKLYKQVDRKWLIISPLFVVSFSMSSLLFVGNWMWILPFFFLQGISVGIFNVSLVTFLQDEVTQDKLTRTFSIYSMITSSMTLPGLLVFGYLLQLIGLDYTLFMMIAALVMIGLFSMLNMPKLGSGKKLKG